MQEVLISPFTLKQEIPLDQELENNVTQIINSMNSVKKQLGLTLAGNESASKRARLALVALEKKTKVFRKLSVKYFKELVR